MRGATRVILQLLQILRLPQEMTFTIDICHKWNVIYKVRSNSIHPPTSPHTSPATQNDRRKSDTNFLKQLKRHLLYNARPIREWSKNDPSMNWSSRPRAYLSQFGDALATKKWRSEESDTATSPNAAPATKAPTSPNIAPAWQMISMIDPAHIRNVICTRSNSTHPVTWLNTSPATQNDILKYEENLLRRMKRHLQWRMIRPWSEHDPNMIWSSRTRRFARLTCRSSEMHFLVKIKTFRVPALDPYFTKCTASHESDTATSPNAAPATKAPTSPNIAPATTNDFHDWSSSHMKRHLPHGATDLSDVWWQVWVMCYLIELLLGWIVTWLNCYWNVTWLRCYLTELWRDGTVSLLKCYFTERLLYRTVTWLSSYFSEPLLCWSSTWLNCYFTELLLDWIGIWLSCYFTELLLTVSLLSCFFTEHLLYWIAPWQSCYFTEFFAFSKIRNSEVSHLTFVWFFGAGHHAKLRRKQRRSLQQHVQTFFSCVLLPEKTHPLCCREALEEARRDNSTLERILSFCCRPSV